MTENILIFYKSKTGFTKKYGEMIAKETGGVLMDFEKGTRELLSSFDTVLFGTRMHAGRIDGLSDIRKLIRENNIKHPILFVTGAMPNTEKQTIEEMWHNNLTTEEMDALPHFYMQSGLCYEKMRFSDKAMMKVFSFMMSRKKDKSPEDAHFAETIAHSYDISSEEYIRPLIDYLRNT